MMKVIILGAGVSGLSCGIRLMERAQETGSPLSAVIWADRRLERTTSAVAAAIWYPYSTTGDPRVPRWGAATTGALRRLVASHGAGIREIAGYELFDRVQPIPEWATELPGAGPGLPPGPAGELYAYGFRFPALLIEMATYLPFLEAWFVRRGGTIETLQVPVSSFDEPLAQADVVINCTGIYAHFLTDDPQLYPSRGQIVRIKPVSIDYFLMDLQDEEELTYIVPRSQDCVLGGTARAVGWDAFDEGPDEETTRRIIERCRRLLPEIREEMIVEPARVGFRPQRADETIRLEPEVRGGKLIVHNYGHGGSGVTLSWGCADDVAAEVLHFLDQCR